MSNEMSADPVVRAAARWFWWIGALSLVNTAMFHAGSNTHFVVGLALTQLTDAVLAGQTPVALAVAAVVIAFYGVVGLVAGRGRLWAFYAGLAVYLLDAALEFWFQDWMSLGFHALAIFYIVKGVMRLRERPAAQPAPAA